VGSVNGKPYLHELAPGAFEELRQKGVVYSAPATGFRRHAKLTPSERISRKPVRVTKEVPIADVFDELQAHGVEFVGYEDVPAWMAAREMSIEEPEQKHSKTRFAKTGAAPLPIAIAKRKETRAADSIPTGKERTIDMRKLYAALAAVAVPVAVGTGLALDKLVHKKILSKTPLDPEEVGNLARSVLGENVRLHPMEGINNSYYLKRKDREGTVIHHIIYDPYVTKSVISHELGHGLKPVPGQGTLATTLGAALMVPGASIIGARKGLDLPAGKLGPALLGAGAAVSAPTLLGEILASREAGKILEGVGERPTGLGTAFASYAAPPVLAGLTGLGAYGLGRLSRTTRLGELLESKPGGPAVKKAQAAKGIPNRQEFGRTEDLPVGELMPWIVQQHLARKAGPHFDIRFGPDKLYSWAARKGVPEPGKKHMAIQQSLHEGSYAKFEGEIEEGYGAGTVKKHDYGSVLVTRAEPNLVSFVVTHRKYPETYSLVRTEGKDWLIINTTPMTSTAHKLYKKIPYAKVDPSKVEALLDGSYAVSAKLDGAASLMELFKDKIEVLSYRLSQTDARPIIHTYRIGGLTGQKIPKELVGSILRAEIYGEQKGKAIPPQELGGLLNATVANSLSEQKARGIELKGAIFDILREGKSDVSRETPYAERLEKVKQVLASLPAGKFIVPPTETDPARARKLYETIRAGKHPLTREGVVATPLQVPAGKPIKVKFTDEADVFITKVFPAELTTEGQRPRAGGFEYSRSPKGGPAVGKVGTGFTFATLEDMLDNPDKYIGRMARIKSQGQFPETGAYRAPSFIALHEDFPGIDDAKNQ
jgi:hypothetical protein